MEFEGKKVDSVAVLVGSLGVLEDTGSGAWWAGLFMVITYFVWIHE